MIGLFDGAWSAVDGEHGVLLWDEGVGLLGGLKRRVCQEKACWVKVFVFRWMGVVWLGGGCGFRVDFLLKLPLRGTNDVQCLGVLCLLEVKRWRYLIGGRWGLLRRFQS